VTVDLVPTMTYKEIAVSSAAHVVEYEHVGLSHFVRLRSRPMEPFFEWAVSVSLLVGDAAIPPGEFMELDINGLNASAAYRPTVGQKAAFHGFASLLYGESQF
jgi:hypothetical protein